MTIVLRLLFVLVLALAAGCGDDDNATTTVVNGDFDDDSDQGTPGEFGETTSAVILINPKINAGSVTSVQPGDQRAGVEVSVQGYTLSATSGASGLAVLSNLPAGSLTLDFGTGTLPLEVVKEKELYDVVVSYKADGVTPIVDTIRYPIGGTVVTVAPGGDIAAAASEDGTIVVLQEGTYPGNFDLTSEGVLLFGAWNPVTGSTSVIDGDVTVRGGNIRMRGVEVTGTIKSNANGFSAAFNEFGGADITGNNVTLIRNVFPEGGSATVPSSSSVLVDNVNIP